MGSIRDKVNIHIPGEAEAGAAVTLTLTVEALDSADSNYAVLHLIVVPLVRLGTECKIQNFHAKPG